MLAKNIKWNIDAECLEEIFGEMFPQDVIEFAEANGYEVYHDDWDTFSYFCENIMNDNPEGVYDYLSIPTEAELPDDLDINDYDAVCVYLTEEVGGFSVESFELGE